jgi:uncharacterized membrane protein YqhA
MKNKKIDGITCILLLIILIFIGAPLWAVSLTFFGIGVYNKFVSENNGKDTDSTRNA